MRKCTLQKLIKELKNETRRESLKQYLLCEITKYMFMLNFASNCRPIFMTSLDSNNLYYYYASFHCELAKILLNIFIIARII